MVVQADPEQSEQSSQLRGRGNIGPAWGRVARRVIVRQDERPAPEAKRISDNLSKRHGDMRFRPRILRNVENGSLVVEVNHAKDFNVLHSDIMQKRSACATLNSGQLLIRYG
jgi:hypothetical protein